MGSETPVTAAQKAIEADIDDAGKKVLARPSSADELLLRLERAEGILAHVLQQPSDSTCSALFNIMKALTMDEILHHNDLNIQVAVASCFNELARITAPDIPYPDDQMKVFFKLCMIAFEQLPFESGPNYSKVLKIVETASEVKSSLIMMDIECDEMIVEMFQLFLNNIRSTHPAKTFKNMEKIMSMVIEESDDISVELLKPLLASVKMDNKNASPISWELGKKVFENSAAKVQPYLKEAVNEMNLDLHDYAEIVASIFNGEIMVPREVAPTVSGGPSRLDELSRAVNEDCDPQSNSGNGNELENNENSLETRRGLQSGTKTVVIRRRRGRKPNSVIRPEEGYGHAWRRSGKYSDDMSSDGYNEEKNGKIFSQKKIFSVGESSKKGRSNRKDSVINENDDLEFSFKVKSKIMQNKAKKKGHNVQKKTGERAISGTSNISESGDEDKNVEKLEEFRMSNDSNPAKGKNIRKEKEKKPKRPRTGCGEELVNLRIQVWWPMDETFYTGTVKAFDSVTKKHTILYDDDEIEILNLRKEKWELFDYEQPPRHALRQTSQYARGSFCNFSNLRKQEAVQFHPSPAKEPVKTQEKTAKRKSGLLKKCHPASSSKRSKSETDNITKSGDNSAPDSIHDEIRETNDFQKDNGEKEKLMKKIESGPHIPEDAMEG